LQNDLVKHLILDSIPIVLSGFPFLLENPENIGIELHFTEQSIVLMVKRILQVLVFISLVSGAAAQTMACVAMMQSDDHACCRAINIRKTKQKMRAAPAQQKEPVKSSNCCESNTSRSQQTPIDNRDSKQEKFTLSNNNEVAITTNVRSLSVNPTRLRASSRYSPPHFILHHSLLI
jgi:hypothetical protein